MLVLRFSIEDLGSEFRARPFRFGLKLPSVQKRQILKIALEGRARSCEVEKLLQTAASAMEEAPLIKIRDVDAMTELATRAKHDH